MDDSERTQVLIRQASDGDQEAVRRLLVLYHPRLRARLTRQMDGALRTRIEPDDILQQVYLEAFRAIATFRYRGPNSFLRWLFTILDRKLIDEHRALRADRRDIRREIHASAPAGQNTTYVDLMQRLAGGTATASYAVRRDEAVGVMLACLATLPDHYRQVIQLRFLDGLPVADVAERLGRSIGSIHMICHRALQQLRDQAEKLGLSADGP